MDAKKNIIHITDTNFDNFSHIWKQNGQHKFICIWDSNTLNYSLELIESIVRLGCLAFISIGQKAEELHDIVDSIASDINIFENPDFEIDTRGGPITNYKLQDALYEAENQMFDDVKEKSKEIYVFTKKNLT